MLFASASSIDSVSHTRYVGFSDGLMVDLIDNFKSGSANMALSGTVSFTVR